MVDKRKFTMFNSEKSVFIKVVNGSKITVAAYVDDFCVLTKDEQLRAWFESELRARFKRIEASRRLE